MLKGSSVNARLLHCDKYKQLLIENFDYLYSDFGDFLVADSRAKRVSKFALENNKKLRGNHLVSRRRIDLDNIEYRITKIFKHFPEIQDWECCHELIADTGNLRGGVYQDDIEKAFLIAKTLKPENRLFYCDYFRTEAKWSFCYFLINHLLEKSIPVDGLSVQLHSNLQLPIKGNPLTLDIALVEKWLTKFKELGLIIHVPEIVVWQPKIDLILTKEKAQKVLDNKAVFKEFIRQGATGILLAPFDIEQLQFKGYFQIIKMLKEKIQPEMIGFWSAFDSSPWNYVGGRCKAGFWDEDYQPKKAAQILIL